MNKPVCLVVSILEISKIVVYEFWYDYVKPKQNNTGKRNHGTGIHTALYST